MTQPVDKSIIDALNAGYAARQQAPTPAPQVPVAGLPTLEDGSVPVVSSAGQVGSVPVANLDAALRSGYRVVSPEAHRYGELKAIAGSDPRQRFLAGSEEAFRNLTFGGSDWFANKYFDPEIVEAMRIRKEANPFLTTGVGLGTQALMVAATGGASLGSLAGRGAATGLARYGGATFLTRAGAKLVPALVEGAVDGAIQGAGAAVSESALANKPLDAERLATAMGVGGLLGAGIGTAIGLPGLARGEARRLYDAGGALLSRTDDMASKLASARAAVGDAGGSAVDRGVAWLDGLAAEHREWARTAADEYGRRSLGGLLKGEKSFETLAKRNPEAAAKAYKLYTEDLATMARGAEGGAAGVTKKEMLQAVEGLNEQQIARHSGILKEADAVVPDKLAADDIVSAMRAAAKEDFGLVGQESGASALNSYARRLENTHGKWEVVDGVRTLVEPPKMSFAELAKTRRELDKKIDWAKSKKLAPQEAAYRRMREILEDSLESKMDSVSGRVGADLLDQWKQVKTDLAASITVKDALERGVAGELANRSMGMGEMLGGISGAVAGSSLLGPVGGLIGGAVSGLANRVIKDRGDQFLAAGLARIAKGESIRTVVDGVQRAVRTEIAKVAEKFPGLSRVKLALGEAAAPALESANGVSLQQSLDAAKGAWSSVSKAASDVAAPVSRAARATGQAAIAVGEREAARWALLRDKVQQAKEDPTALDASRRISGSTHPDLQQALDAQSARTVGVLAKVLPPTPPPTFDIRGPQPRPAPPRAAQVAAARTIAVLDDPTEVVRRVQSGDLRPGDVQALSEAYPEQFARMQQDIVDEFYGRDLDPATRRRLGMVLGGPTDQTMTAPYLAAMAAGSAEWGAEVTQDRPNRRSAPVRGASETAMTPAQKLGMGRG